MACGCVFDLLSVTRIGDRNKDILKFAQNIRLASVEAEEEKNILAAFISELPEGVLICNAEGQILLYNRQARQFLEQGKHHSEFGEADSEDSHATLRLGHSVFTVIDKNLIEHALDEINERLKHKVVNAVSHFIIGGEGNLLLQAQVVPILNCAGQFAGFIIILNDITRQHETNTQVNSLLQSLTKSARSPLASIRSAIEAMIEYPDMDRTHFQEFKDIIYNESIVLSNILNKVARDCSSLVKAKRSLVPVLGTDLLETIRRRAGDRLGIRINFEKPVGKNRVRADSYSIIIAMLFVLNQLKRETGCWEFTCQLWGDQKFIRLDLRWQGSPLRTETLRKWKDRFLTIEEEDRCLLTLRGVLEHHGAEIWSHSGEMPEDQPYVRLLLPADTAPETERLRPVTVLSESHTGFYDLGLFNPSDQNPGPDNRLLTELTYTSLIRNISETDSIRELRDKHCQLPGLIHSMMAGGTKVRNVTSLITTFSDAIFKKMAGLAMDEMGPPPARFAFIVLGSEGRKEQTLKTDQDNAIIFEDLPEGSEQDAHNYFLALGEKVCTWLDQAGYDFCAGGIMAKTPKWCQPLSGWKKYFSDWIHAAEPEDLLHSSIFFDFRFVCGDTDIVDNLGKYLSDSLVGWTGFFRHLTENALHFRPPIGFFGNFVTESKGRHRNALDIKSAMTPIVDFARIYALNNNIRETNTQERLYRLCLKKVLSRDEYNDIEQAYAYVMQLRFVRQITAIVDERTEPDNYLNPGKLSRIERKMLKVIFKRIEKIQSKLSFDFIGEV